MNPDDLDRLADGVAFETEPDEHGLFAIAQREPGGAYLFGQWTAAGRLHHEAFATVGDLIERMAAYTAIER